MHVILSCRSFYVPHEKIPNSFLFANKLCYMALSSIVLTMLKKKSGYFDHNNAPCRSKGLCPLHHILATCGILLKVHFLKICNNGISLQAGFIVLLYLIFIISIRLKITWGFFLNFNFSYNYIYISNYIIKCM